MIEICEQEPYLSESRIEVITKAKDSGLVVFDFTEAVGRILTLDLDGGCKVFQEKVMQDPSAQWTGTNSKSQTSGRTHGFVVVGEDTAWTADAHYAKAVILGSDPVRELASHERYPAPHAYLMFETQEAAQVLRRWLASLPEGLQKLVKEL